MNGEIHNKPNINQLNEPKSCIGLDDGRRSFPCDVIPGCCARLCGGDGTSFGDVSLTGTLTGIDW